MATIRTEPVTINLGPQHPSTHGVFRLRVTFDGEEIVDLEPVFGYLHRGTERRFVTQATVRKLLQGNTRSHHRNRSILRTGLSALQPSLEQVKHNFNPDFF